jgi:hypothetical protein
MTLANPLQPDRSSIGPLLTACARGNLDESKLFQIRSIVSDSLDWDALLKTASDHGVLPLLHRAVACACADLIPPATMALLTQKAQENGRRNMLLMRELLSLISEMSAVGVRVLPYKGPVLAHLAYGDLSLRQCGDLDILVPQADVERAREILVNRGYSLPMKMDAAEEARYVASPHEYDFAYIRSNPYVMVELHWQVVGRFFSFAPDPQELWNRASDQNIAGTDVRMLQPEDLLLILCAHGTKHFWSRLTWICDIAHFLKSNPSLDWELLLKRADEYDAVGMLMLGLLLAHGVFDAELPQVIIDRTSAANRAQALELEHRLFLPSNATDTVPLGAKMQLGEGGLLQSLLFQFRTRSSVDQRNEVLLLPRVLAKCRRSGVGESAAEARCGVLRRSPGPAVHTLHNRSYPAILRSGSGSTPDSGTYGTSVNSPMMIRPPHSTHEWATNVPAALRPTPI